MEAASRHVARLPRWFLISAILMLCIPLATLILNHSAVHRLVLQHLSSEMGIEISALHVQIFPRMSIEIYDLLVRDPGNSEPILRAPQASLSLRFWPLVMKQVAMVELDAGEPEVVIRRDRDGLWHVPLIHDKNTDAASDSTRYQWIVTDFQVRDGSLLIVDEDRLAAGGVRIRQVEAAFEIDQAHSRADVMLRGKSDDGGDLRLTGSLSLAKHDRSNAVAPDQFNGSFRFDRVNLAYWLERAGQSLGSPHNKMAWRGNVSAGIHFEFLPGTHGVNVTISNMKTDLDWAVVRGQGSVQGAGTSHPAYALTLSTSPISSETFFEHVPPSWIPGKVETAVNEHMLKGTVELVSVALKGRINVLREPDEWSVVANVSNGSSVWGKNRTLVHNLSARLSLDPKRADVLHAAGDVNGVHFTTSKLTVSDLDLGPTLDVHVAAVGQFEQVLAILQQFDESKAGKPVFQSIKDARGTLGLVVHLNGPILPNPSLRVINAEMAVHDLGARFARNLMVRQVNGRISADSRLIEVKHIQGEIQGIDFHAEGTVDVESEPRIHDLKIHMSSDGKVIQKLLAAFLPVPAPLLIEGPAHATVNLSGTRGAAYYRSTIDLTGTEIIVPSSVHKRKGISGRLEFEGNVLDGKRINIDGFRLAVSETEIQAAAQFDLARTPKFHIQMKAGPVSLRTLAALGVQTPLKEGILETSAVVTGEGTNWKLWAPSGWVSLQRGTVALPGLGKELTEVSGRVQVSQRGAVLDKLSFKLGESDVKLTGMIERWRSHPRAILLVESSQLNVENLVSHKTGNRATTSGGLQEWMRSKAATITFLVDQVKYERLILKTVSGEITVDEHKAKLIGLRGETPKGVLAGRVEARLGPQERMDLDAEMSMDGIPAEQVWSAKQGETEPLQGNLSMSGGLKATVDADTPIQNTLSTARHGLTIKVTNGRLHQDPVLTKVLKILNLPAVLIGQVDLSQRGIPFDSLSARIIAKNGLFSSEDIVFDSPIIKVTGAGTADLKDDGLDLALAVSPVAAYSELVGKVPLFGPLLRGDRPGLSTALFEAKGSLQDPEVSYLPLESFGKGLTGYPRLAVDVLLNTINLPQTALALSTE